MRGIPKPPFLEEVVKPEFRKDIFAGAPRVWDTLCWLLAESQVHYCRDILNSATLYLSAGNLATTVFEHCAKQKSFKTLYEQGCKSQMADHLSGGHEKNRMWDYVSTNIASCLYTRQLFRWVRTFVSLIYLYWIFSVD